MQAITSEGLALGLYVAASVGFEPSAPKARTSPISHRAPINRTRQDGMRLEVELSGGTGMGSKGKDRKGFKG